MGHYLNTSGKRPLGPKHKGNTLISDAGAVPLFDPPKKFRDIPDGKALICIIDNGPFEAALLVHDENELRVSTNVGNRPTAWLLMDKKLAHELAGFRAALHPHG